MKQRFPSQLTLCALFTSSKEEGRKEVCACKEEAALTLSPTQPLTHNLPESVYEKCPQQGLNCTALPVHQLDIFSIQTDRQILLQLGHIEDPNDVWRQQQA